MPKRFLSFPLTKINGAAPEIVDNKIHYLSIFISKNKRKNRFVGLKKK